MDDKIKRVFKINRIDLYFIIAFIMVGVNMLFTLSLIDPLRDIADNQLFIARVGITQNEEIIDILTNSTSNSTRDLIIDMVMNKTTK